MYQNEIEQLSNAAVKKYDKAAKHPQSYMMSAMVAGFFIFIATILSGVMTATLTEFHPGVGKVVGAILFSTAIILIVFIGGELFTGNNMTMAFGMYSGKTDLKKVCKVWIYSYVGNFAGILLMCLLFYFSGAQKALLTDYYSAIIPAKLSATGLSMFLKGILCNYMVCLSVFAGTRMKSESGKIIVMMLSISTFIISGFEHSIANMCTLLLAAFLTDTVSVVLALKCMLFVTLGNIIGGAVLFAYPMHYITNKE